MYKNLVTGHVQTCDIYTWKWYVLRKGSACMMRDIVIIWFSFIYRCL